MTRIRFIPQARAEVEAETRYYRREAGSKISKRFVQSVEQAARLALEFPGAGSPGPEGTRRMQLRDFPFALIYRPEKAGIVVFALAPNAREPEYWSKRLT